MEEVRASGFGVKVHSMKGNRCHWWWSGKSSMNFNLSVHESKFDGDRFFRWRGTLLLSLLPLLLTFRRESRRRKNMLCVSLPQQIKSWLGNIRFRVTCVE